MKTKLIALIILCTASVAAQAQTTAYSGRLFVYPQGNYVKSNGSATVTAAFPSQLFNWGFTSGTNVNQMNALYSEGPTTLTNGQSKTISLLAATNAFGDVLEFSRVHWLAVKAGTENETELTALDAFPDGFRITQAEEWVAIPSGGLLFIAAPSVAGLPVTTNSHNVNVVNPGTNNATYELYIGGVAE